MNYKFSFSVLQYNLCALSFEGERERETHRERERERERESGREPGVRDKERERTTEREKDIKNKTRFWRQRKIEREAWWERER